MPQSFLSIKFVTKIPMNNPVQKRSTCSSIIAERFQMQSFFSKQRAYTQFFEELIISGGRSP